MRLTNKQILNLPVYTQAGDFLGRITGFEVDTNSRAVVKYFVGSSSFVKNLLSDRRELVINDSQVISLSEEKMTVEDSVIGEKASTEEVAAGQSAVSAGLSSKMD